MMIAPARSNRTLRHPNDTSPTSSAAEEYPIAPDAIEEIDAEKRVLAVARLEAAERAVEEELHPTKRLAVSRRFLCLLAVAALATLVVGWSLPASYFAFLCGITAFVWMIATGVFRAESAYIEWTWWTILAMYGVAVLRAMITGE